MISTVTDFRCTVYDGSSKNSKAWEKNEREPAIRIALREKCCRGSYYRTGRQRKFVLSGNLRLFVTNRRIKRENFRGGNDAESYVLLPLQKKKRKGVENGRDDSGD